MAEGDNTGRTIKEIISDATDRQLDQFPPKVLSPEELKNWATRQKTAGKKRLYKVAAAAALFFVVLAGAVLALNYRALDVGADQNPKEEIVTEDGVVIEDGGWGSSNDILTIESWDEISIVQRDIDRMLIPKKIPSEYSFCKMTVEELEGGSIACIFYFTNSDAQTLEIHEFIHNNSLEYFKVEDMQKEINSTKGTIYLKEVNENKIATIQTDDGIIINIYGVLTDKQILYIVENLG